MLEEGASDGRTEKRPSVILLPVPQGGRERGKGGEGKQRLDGRIEIERDLHRQLQAWLIIAAFEIADRLRVPPHRLGEVAPRHDPIGTEQSDSVEHSRALDELLCLHNRYTYNWDGN